MSPLSFRLSRPLGGVNQGWGETPGNAKRFGQAASFCGNLPHDPDGDAKVEVSPDAVGGVDGGAEFLGKRKAAAVAERQAKPTGFLSPDSSLNRLTFRQGLTPKPENLYRRPYALVRKTELNQFGNHLGKVDGRDCKATSGIIDHVAPRLIQNDGEDSRGIKDDHSSPHIARRSARNSST